MNYLYVGIGSAVGGMARFAVGSWLQRRMEDWAGARLDAMPFPLGTLFVNVTGSFVLGVLLVLISRQQATAGETTRLLLAVGLCGGYTTFSTFSAETVGLFERGETGFGVLNIGASLGLGVLATVLGIVLARLLIARPA